jgi:HD-GYP domain-containing protein (c-di-GMP phosphodiesterase class II)
MADKLQIQAELQVDGHRLERARGYDHKLQELGRALLSGLFMLIRNARLYDPDNAIFLVPLEKLREVTNTIVTAEGSLNLQVAGDSFYLNHMLVRIDLKFADNTRQLRDEFEAHDIGGFSLQEPMSIEELKRFVSIFAQEARPTEDQGGVTERKLAAIKLRRFEKIQEILQKQAATPLDAARLAEQKLDRKRYGLVVYARTLVYMRRLIAGLRGQGPAMSLGKAQHFVQDLVDVLHGHRTNLLGLASLNPGDERLAFHAVNTAMLAIVLGSALGLRKDRLRDLGLAALFHDLGKAELDEALLVKRDRLTAPERTQLARAPRLTVRRLLLGAPLNMRMAQCLIAAHDHALDYGHLVHDHLGEAHHVARDRELGLYPRLVALAEAFDTLVGLRELAPELALNVMSTDLRHRFDPELLRVFCHLMKGYTHRVMDREKLEIF